MFYLPADLGIAQLKRLNLVPKPRYFLFEMIVPDKAFTERVPKPNQEAHEQDCAELDSFSSAALGHGAISPPKRRIL